LASKPAPDPLNQWFLSRALDFISSASVLCSDLHDGWLPSANLLIGFAAELLAKKQLLERGVSAGALRRAPYGHDLIGMWKEKTGLYVEASAIAEELRAAGAIEPGFDFDPHFEALGAAHGLTGNYSLRYHGGVREFSCPAALTLILAEIARRERMRTQTAVRAPDPKEV
jgi:hypothetical protein